MDYLQLFQGVWFGLSYSVPAHLTISRLCICCRNHLISLKYITWSLGRSIVDSLDLDSTSTAEADAGSRRRRAKTEHGFSGVFVRNCETISTVGGVIWLAGVGVLWSRRFFSFDAPI